MPLEIRDPFSKLLSYYLLKTLRLESLPFKGDNVSRNDTEGIWYGDISKNIANHVRRGKIPDWGVLVS